MPANQALTDIELNRRWRPALMAFFLRRVRNRAEAEDMTQEVFVRMLSNVARTPDGQPTPADAFIFQIAQNLIIDRARALAVRSAYRETVANDKLRDTDFVDAHQVLSGKEDMAAFLSALDQLPDRTRAIFVLYRFENMSQETIAAAYGISISAVKKHVGRALAFLNRKMRNPR